MPLRPAAVLAGAAAAHHSPAAFDQTREIRVEGKLTKYAFNNPHTTRWWSIPSAFYRTRRGWDSA